MRGSRYHSISFLEKHHTGLNFISRESHHYSSIKRLQGKPILLPLIFLIPIFHILSYSGFLFQSTCFCPSYTKFEKVVQGTIHLVRTQNFSLSNPSIHSRTCVSGGQKCQFSRQPLLMFPGIYKVSCYHTIPLKMLNTVIVFQLAMCLLYTIT